MGVGELGCNWWWTIDRGRGGEGPCSYMQDRQHLHGSRDATGFPLRSLHFLGSDLLHGYPLVDRGTFMGFLFFRFRFHSTTETRSFLLCFIIVFLVCSVGLDYRHHLHLRSYIYIVALTVFFLPHISFFHHFFRDSMYIRRLRTWIRTLCTVV